MNKLFKIVSVVLPAVLLGTEPAHAQSVSTTNGTHRTLADLSIEELMDERVTSVSKKATKLSESPAAVAVITQEDIRRSGALSIPEALRMAPGLEVAHVDANKWAISSRGFNGLYTDKLLVMIDGRSVYTPLFAGVHWDTQDTMLEDVDRIEVIRGPGATMWGANAVNGVINIITKSAKETQGAVVTAGAGTEERGFGAIRYGGKISDDTHYRVYVKYFNRDDSVDAAGRQSRDEWDMFRTGFRVDWEPSTENNFTFQGDYYDGHTIGVFPPNQLDLSQSVVEKLDLSGGNILGRWKHDFSESSHLELQSYYDRVERRSPYSVEVIDTFDIDGQHRFALGERNEVIWGVGYRLIADHGLSAGFASFDPDSATHQVVSSFLQDEIRIVPDRLRLTLGSKFEHNDYTGFELQPNARLLFTPNEKHGVWGAVSRAVRTPARYESDIRFKIGSSPGGGGIPPTEINLLGNPDIKSEKLIAYELGYRVQPNAHVSFDIASFYNVYDDLRTAERGQPKFVMTPSPHVEVPLRLANRMHGETYGTEIAANWKVTDSWKLGAGYTWLNMGLHNTGNDTTAEGAVDDNPEHQFHLRSYLDLPHHFQFDTAIYYVDRLARQNAPAYVRLDVRLGWQPTPNFDFSIGIQNLLDDRHPEFGTSTGAHATEVERNFYGKLTWRF
jgi:iron complex outermembrane receptor protein